MKRRRTEQDKEKGTQQMNEMMKGELEENQNNKIQSHSSELKDNQGKLLRVWMMASD